MIVEWLGGPKDGETFDVKDDTDTMLVHFLTDQGNTHKMIPIEIRSGKPVLIYPGDPIHWMNNA